MVDERYLAIVIGVDACGLLIPSLRRPRWVASTEVLIPPPCFTCQKGCITRSEGKRDEAKRKDSGCHTTTQTDRIVCLLFNVCYLLFLFFFLRRCCSSSLLFLVFLLLLLLRFVLVPASGAGVVGGGSHGLLVAAVVCAIVGGGGSQEVPVCF